MLKKIVAIVLIFVVCVIPVSVFADEPEEGNVTVMNETPTESTVIVEPTYQDTNVQVLRVSASDTTGLHSVLLSLIGDYNPIVKDYTYYTTSYNGTQTLNHSIDIQPDFSWLATALLFIVIVYCVFRLIGMLFGGVKI